MELRDVDLRGLKDAARRLFPPGHAVREAMLREPDHLPRSEAEAVLAAYLRLALALRTA